MVAIEDTDAPQMAGLLEEALRELERLHSSVECERRMTASWVADKLLAFSPPALDRLYAVIREGYDAIARRAGELSRGETTVRAQAQPLSAEIQREAGDETTIMANPRSLLVAYRACARALCASMVEARKISDSTTTALLSGLVHRLEKQLWLLDSSQSRPRVGLPTINLFLSC